MTGLGFICRVGGKPLDLALCPVMLSHILNDDNYPLFSMDIQRDQGNTMSRGLYHHVS